MTWIQEETSMKIKEIGMPKGQSEEREGQSAGLSGREHDGTYLS